MTRLASISAKKLIKILVRLGFIEIRRKSSHRFFLNPTTKLTAVVPDHGAEDVGVGLLRSILRGIEVDVEEFEELR